LANTETGANVSTDRLSRVLMISPRRVQQLVKEGVLTKEGRGRYPLVPNVQAYIKYWQERASGSNDDADIDYHVERARLTKSQADGQEMKNAVMRRELAPVDLIEWTLNKVASQIGAVLDSIPQKVKRRVPSLTAAQIDFIKREIVTCQNSAAKITVDLDEYEDQLDAD